MKKFKLFLIIFLLLLIFFPGCKTVGEEDDVDYTIYEADLVLDSHDQTLESFERVSITGIVTNKGNRTGYNSMIKLSAYDNSNTIIDTAAGFPADLGDIPINTSAEFNAVFFELETWDRVTKITYRIEWLNRDGTISTGSNTGEFEIEKETDGLVTIVLTNLAVNPYVAGYPEIVKFTAEVKERHEDYAVVHFEYKSKNHNSLKIKRSYDNGTYDTEYTLNYNSGTWGDGMVKYSATYTLSASNNNGTSEKGIHVEVILPE